MPGVTVTLTSPSLQVGQIMVGVGGRRQLSRRRTASRTLSHQPSSWPASKSYVLSDFRLTIGFVARVDAAMAVGGLEESITVTGASPVVDMTSTTTSVNLTSDTHRIDSGGPRVAAVVRDDAWRDD